jgi:hypothetical protein
MKGIHMTTDRTLSLSTVTHIINAPIEKVDIADWLFNLPDAEYQRCSPVHIAAGHTISDDGRPMSINVETIGEAIMVQHFVGEELKPHFCRLTSTSDAITAKGRTNVHLLWELSVKKIDDNTCEYSNHIHATATEEFLAFIEKNGVTFEQARAARQQASDAHNRQETPNFAKSIEQRALSRQ